MSVKSLVSVAAIAALAGPVTAGQLFDGGFESQATLQRNPYWLQPSGQKWGAAWNNWGWSSWQANNAGAWIGGGIARTEDFATGWKWARSGDVFGIIKDRQTMSQTFTATASGTGTLSWFDANRSAWRGDTWFGRQNDYRVSIIDSLGNTQTIGNYTSEVYLGLDSNSWNNWGDDRFSLAGKQGWFARTGANFTLQAGMTYTLSFTSLSPYIRDLSGTITGVDDRTTFLDDITLTVIPSPGPVALLGLGALLAARRCRASS